MITGKPSYFKLRPEYLSETITLLEESINKYFFLERLARFSFDINVFSLRISDDDKDEDEKKDLDTFKCSIAKIKESIAQVKTILNERCQITQSSLDLDNNINDLIDIMNQLESALSKYEDVATLPEKSDPTLQEIKELFIELDIIIDYIKTERDTQQNVVSSYAYRDGKFQLPEKISQLDMANFNADMLVMALKGFQISSRHDSAQSLLIDFLKFCTEGPNFIARSFGTHIIDILNSNAYIEVDYNNTSSLTCNIPYNENVLKFLQTNNVNGVSAETHEIETRSVEEYDEYTDTALNGRIKIKPHLRGVSSSIHYSHGVKFETTHTIHPCIRLTIQPAEIGLQSLKDISNDLQKLYLQHSLLTATSETREDIKGV